MKDVTNAQKRQEQEIQQQEEEELEEEEEEEEVQKQEEVFDEVEEALDVLEWSLWRQFSSDRLNAVRAAAASAAATVVDIRGVETGRGVEYIGGGVVLASVGRCGGGRGAAAPCAETKALNVALGLAADYGSMPSFASERARSGYTREKLSSRAARVADYLLLADHALDDDDNDAGDEEEGQRAPEWVRGALARQRLQDHRRNTRTTVLLLLLRRLLLPLLLLLLLLLFEYCCHAF